MLSSLRRSERTRSHSSSSTSDSRSSGSLSSSPKPRKEKSVRQLTFEAKQVNGSEEYEVGTPQVELKRMTARMYRALFEVPKEGNVVSCFRLAFLFQQLCFPLLSHEFCYYICECS